MSPETIRLLEIDLAVGEPLGYDVYDAKDRLLLDRGYVISTQTQLERLLERGAYGVKPEVEAARCRARGVPVPCREGVHKVEISIFGWVGEAQSTLEKLLALSTADGGFPDAVLDIARVAQRCCSVDPDATIANVFINRKYRYAIRQAINAALVCEILGRQAGMDERARQSVLAAALTMNMEIMTLQDELYLQRDALTSEQKLAIGNHPSGAEQRLRELGVRDTVWLRAVLQHHEANNGSGYPARLTAQSIAPEAQMLALADQFCAVVSERATRPGVLPSIVLRKLLSERHPFDIRLAAILVKEIGIFPPGALARLRNGDLAVVVKRTRNANQPIVRALVNAGGRILDGFPKRLTSKPTFVIEEAIPLETLSALFSKHWRTSDLEHLWDSTTVGVRDDGEFELAECALTR